MEKVSIVLPVYNGEQFLRESIDSVLAQTYGQYELIIVNDASTDQSLAIASEYARKDPRVHVYTNDHNCKLPQSLNNGFRHASGELFTWTSDDNIMLPDFLEKMVSAFQTHPDVDFVYARQNFIDEKGRVYKERKYPKDMDDIYIRDTVGAAFMYRRKVHEALGGYDTTKFLVEDYDFWLRAYEQFRFYYLPELVFSYRVHKGSLTETRLIEQKMRVLDLLQEVLARTDDPKKQAKIKAGLSYQYMFLSDHYFTEVKAASIGHDWQSMIPHRLRLLARELLAKPRHS